ncbi:MAG: hypothetical protein QOI21_1125 [Actinomycetota bacterium]|jgi:anti-anti-sigma factor|nr:hypothetical protein [Actinomycetota bacterium]
MVNSAKPPRLSVHRSRHDGTEIVHIAGEVDMSTVDTLERDLLDTIATASPPSSIVLECSEVTFLGSCGISLLLSVHRAALLQNTPVRIVAPQRAVRRPVQLIGFDRTLRLHDSLEEAVRRPVLARSGSIPR